MMTAPTPAEPICLADCWAEIRQHCIPVDTPEPLIEDMQSCYYMGAAAVFNLWREDKGAEIIGELHAEIAAFQEQTKGRSYVGGVQ